VLVAGAVTSAAILGGLALPLAFVGGAAAWAAKVALSLPRRRGGSRPDPFRLGEPWRHHVSDALSAQRRFEQTVRRTASGPLRESLAHLKDRIDQGVAASWRVAQQGDQLDDALRRMDLAAIRRELADLEGERGRYREGQEPGSLAQTIRSVEAQQAAGERLASVAAGADERLRLLNAQLDEAVARAIELSVSSAAGPADVDTLTSGVDGIVGQLEALRQGLEEVEGASRPATS
jgi:hypothetical protein